MCSNTAHLVLQPNFAAYPRLLTIYDAVAEAAAVAVAEIGCAKSVGMLCSLLMHDQLGHGYKPALERHGLTILKSPSESRQLCHKGIVLVSP